MNEPRQLTELEQQYVDATAFVRFELSKLLDGEGTKERLAAAIEAENNVRSDLYEAIAAKLTLHVKQ